jgi:hypothetical protein
MRKRKQLADILFCFRKYNQLGQQKVEAGIGSMGMPIYEIIPNQPGSYPFT